jgi:hypothetical protein
VVCYAPIGVVAVRDEKGFQGRVVMTVNQNIGQANQGQASQEQVRQEQENQEQISQEQADQAEVVYSVQLRLVERGFWNLLFLFIIYYYVVNVLLPSFGDNLNLKFTRLGLLCEIIGLLSLAPDYFGDRIKKLDNPKEIVARRAEEQRRRFFKFRKVLDKSVLEPTHNVYLSFIHFSIKIMICLFVGFKWYFNGVNFLGDNPILIWIAPTLEIMCSLWVVLAIMNFIYEKLKWKLSDTLIATYHFVDSALSLPFYLPAWIFISLMNYFLSGLTVTEEVPMGTLLLKLAIPFIVAGTVLQFYATYK